MLAGGTTIVTQHVEECALMEGKYIQVSDFIMLLSIMDFSNYIYVQVHKIKHSDVFVQNELEV